jgi:hypothetical protein
MPEKPPVLNYSKPTTPRLSKKALSALITIWAILMLMIALVGYAIQSIE